MSERQRMLRLLAAVMVAVVAGATPASAAQKGAARKEGRVAGIVFDYDRDHHWLTVKADGDDAPVKYLIDPANTALAEALQSVFNASRVRLAYRAEGDARRLVAIERQVLQASGTVTGVVVAIHNDFWLELKPRRGVADAFAPGANYNDKAFMARYRSLKPGDSVTIQFNTDFERHRILALRKNAATSKPSTKMAPQASPDRGKD